jgi:hypothetical protein
MTRLRLLPTAAVGMFAALVPVRAPAQNAPSQLHGKSIVLGWTETRMQRRAGSGGDYQSRAITQSLSVYVSSQGRLFSRRTATNPKGAGGKREGVGEAGQSATGGLRNSRFQGGNLVVSTELAGGARLVTVSFGGGFSSCTASVTIAREAGRQTMQVKSFADGGMIEVQSVTASAPSCSIRAGNVFGE